MAARTTFSIITDPGNNQEIITDHYYTKEARLAELQDRALAYYQGTRFAVPAMNHEGDQAQGLAMLLGFFLMLSNGSVTLVEEPAAELDYQAHIFEDRRCLFCNVRNLDEDIYGPFDCVPRGQYSYTSESAAPKKETQS